MQIEFNKSMDYLLKNKPLTGSGLLKDIYKREIL